MENLSQYREIITRLISDYAKVIPSRGDVQVETIFDETNDHYELMHSGWNGAYRIHGSVLHVDIREGKVWIQYDGTPDGFANELVNAGIPRNHIVLAFKDPELRKHTDFAAA